MKTAVDKHHVNFLCTNVAHLAEKHKGATAYANNILDSFKTKTLHRLAELQKLLKAIFLLETSSLISR